MQAVLSIYGLKQLVNERNATYNDLFFTYICFFFFAETSSDAEDSRHSPGKYQY